MVELVVAGSDFPLPLILYDYCLSSVKGRGKQLPHQIINVLCIGRVGELVLEMDLEFTLLPYVKGQLPNCLSSWEASRELQIHLQHDFPLVSLLVWRLGKVLP